MAITHYYKPWRWVQISHLLSYTHYVCVCLCSWTFARSLCSASKIRCSFSLIKAMSWLSWAWRNCSGIVTPVRNTERSRPTTWVSILSLGKQTNTCTHARQRARTHTHTQIKLKQDKPHFLFFTGSKSSSLDGAEGVKGVASAKETVVYWKHKFKCTDCSAISAPIRQPGISLQCALDNVFFCCPFLH